MDIYEALQQELKEENKSLTIRTRKVDLSDTDIVRLNNIIKAKDKKNQKTVEKSLDLAKRYSCTA